MIFFLRTTILLGLLFNLASCASEQPSELGLPTGEPVILTADHRTGWRKLWIEGSTNLPDGAMVTYQVTHELAKQLAPNEWPALNLIEFGKATVQDGQYWTELNTTRWPAGIVDLIVQFPVPPQPDFVVAKYGEFGENLQGDNITTIDTIKIVQVEHTFKLNP